MMKKVLIVVTKSNFGGAQRYVYDLATRLPRELFESAVAFGLGEEHRAGRLSRLLVEKSVRTLVVPELQRDISIRKDWLALLTLLAMFKKEKPDVVHLNSSKAGGLGVLAARIAGVPRIVYTIHGLPADENRSLLQKQIVGLLTWLTALLSHRVITISNDAFQRIRKLPLLYSKTTCIYNGIDPIDFLHPHDALKELKTIDPTIPDRGVRIGMIGELHPNKDIETALAVLPHTKSAHLIIIGDGELREALRMRAQSLNVHDRVHFLGYIPDAARYLRACDVFLLTSRKEGLPYVILEAGAAHVPVIAVDIPSVHDVVLNEFTGLLVPRDPALISEAVHRIAHGEALARSLTEEMGKRVQATFSLHQMVEKTVATYL